MTTEIVERVLRSRRYHDVDPALVERLAAEELVRSRNVEDAVKRVKRRLHQAVGAFRGERRGDPLDSVRAAWTGDLGASEFRAATADVLATHASTRERLADLPAFYGPIWEVTGSPSRVLDIGCGLGPLALPWMGLDAGATYHAVDVDQRTLETVEGFLGLVGQPHLVVARDAVSAPPVDQADLALLLKLVPTLDRQDTEAAVRLIAAVPARHAVVSFARRSLAGRGRGMDRTYRERFERLVAGVSRVRDVVERSVPSELVFVLELDWAHG